MCAVTIFLFVTFLAFTGTTAECETGWTIYKDELCIKAFPDLVTYQEAKLFCSNQSEGKNVASLVMVKSSDFQNLLVNYTNDIYNSLWLGGQFDEGTGQYKWDDGEVFSYTNWQEGYPRNSSDTACVELKPINSRQDAEAKWADASCQKRIQVMCQRAAPWSLQDAVEEIKRLREELRSGSNAFPIGAIYIEYNNQTNPQALWPGLVWEDVSSLYAGLFFRATGGDSASWGSIQAECAPRIIEAQHVYSPLTYPVNNTIPPNGWSGYGASGRFGVTGDMLFEGMRFYTARCEVRPRNQAVRVWKRVG